MSPMQEWIENQWPSTMFLDPRIRKRVVIIAQACLKRPSSNIPGRFNSVGETKGCYRFFSRTDMGHDKLQSGHYEYVREESLNSKGKVLFIQDGSELLYNTHEWTMGLGPTGDSCGSGIMFHSCLAVAFEEERPKVIGLSAQKAWIREEKDDKTKVAKDKAAKTEADVWREMLEKTGPVPVGHNWITVGDRASDIFSFVKVAKALGYGCVIRTKHDRKIRVNSSEYQLKAFMRSLPEMACKQYIARSTPTRTTHAQTLKISWTEAEMLPPQSEKGKEVIKGSYVRVCCEENPDLEWILFTLSPIVSAEDALEIVSIYEHRWVIEEYHKCLKSGCKIEEAQLKTAGRLLNLFGILGIIATQLLQLRDISRIKSEDPAERHVNPLNLALIKNQYKITGPITVKEFWRRVAMLGGFLGRKSDKNPGWQTIWRGWLRLQDMYRGAELALEALGDWRK